MSDIPTGGGPAEADRDDDRDTDEGRGSEGTIPDSSDGLAVGVSGEKNTFEPEEDPEASNAPE